MKKFLSLTLAGTIAAVALTGCAPQQQTLILVQPLNSSKQVLLDSNPAGDPGDSTAFESVLEKDGKYFGGMLGTTTKVSAMPASIVPGSEERLLTAIFDLLDGEISVSGITHYNPTATRLDLLKPVTRAITGGTGAYVGVRGEVTTTRNEDDTFTHVLRMWK